MYITTDDRAYLQQWMKVMDPQKLYWGFTCFSRQDYAGVEKEGRDEVTYGIYSSEGGCLMEICMIFGENGVKMRIFDEAFPLATSPTHLEVWHKLLRLGEDFTSDEFSKELIGLGFQDDSDRSINKAASGQRGA